MRPFVRYTKLRNLLFFNYFFWNYIKLLIFVSRLHKLPTFLRKLCFLAFLGIIWNHVFFVHDVVCYLILLLKDSWLYLKIIVERGMRKQCVSIFNEDLVVFLFIILGFIRHIWVIMFAFQFILSLNGVYKTILRIRDTLAGMDINIRNRHGRRGRHPYKWVTWNVLEFLFQPFQVFRSVFLRNHPIKYLIVFNMMSSQ
jgi:hypothetical protein